jgi:hypothetical protein
VQTSEAPPKKKKKDPPPTRLGIDPGRPVPVHRAGAEERVPLFICFGTRDTKKPTCARIYNFQGAGT